MEAIAPLGAVRVYDSDRRPLPVIDELRNLWEFRGLVRMLIARDVVLRYKRSILGVWWTLLNPLLTMAVMWVVFSRLFRPVTDVPYVVYLLSGLIVITFLQQAVLGVGGSILSSADVLSKVHAPPEVFAVSAAFAAAVNFAVSLVPLLLITVAVGVSIPPTLPLIIVPVLALLALGTGVGLLIASLAVRFQDTLELTNLALLLALYLSPVFYPASIVDERYRFILTLNPMYHVLGIFRALLYEGTMGPWTSYLVMGVSAVFALVAGSYVFARSWRSAVVML